MIDVQAPADCGNAPKKRVLRDFTVALVERDEEAVLAAVSDDVEWDLVGRRIVHGKVDFTDAVAAALGGEVATLHLDAILTHGNEGAVSSRILFRGSGQLRCCDVYKFSGFGKTAKIKRITSYWIEV